MGDDDYRISVAKTEYRDGFNSGDAAKVLSVFAPEFVDLSEGQPSFYGAPAATALRKRLDELFAAYETRMFVIVSKISVDHGQATDWGWHKLWLTPKSGGDTVYLKLRYFETWKRQQDGEWKITFFISNREPGVAMGPLPETKALAVGS